MGFPPPSTSTGVNSPLGTVQTFNGLGVTSATCINASLGTSAAPDSGLKPLQKISRLFSHLSTDIASGDGAEQLAGISSMVAGDAANQVQSVGMYGAAHNAGTGLGARLSPDACGVYGFGYISSTGVGVGIGAFFLGRKDNASARITSMQVATWNNGAASAYAPTGAIDCGLMMWADGTYDSAAGILFAGGARHYDVGLGFQSTSNITTATFQDDGQAPTSIVINGTRSGYGIDLNGGTFTGGPIRLKNNAAIVARKADNSADVQLLKLNTSNRLELLTNLTISDSANVLVGSTTGTKIGTQTTQKIGFWNATPIVQPTTAISAASNTNPGTGTAVTTTSTFGGYTLAQLAAVLINTGLAA